MADTRDIRDYEFADLNGEQISAVKDLERQLSRQAVRGGDVVVIVYQASPKAGTNPTDSQL